MSARARRAVGLPGACSLTGTSWGVLLSPLAGAHDVGGDSRLGGEGL